MINLYTDLYQAQSIEFEENLCDRIRYCCFKISTLDFRAVPNTLER